MEKLEFEQPPHVTPLKTLEDIVSERSDYSIDFLRQVTDLFSEIDQATAKKSAQNCLFFPGHGEPML